MDLFYEEEHIGCYHCSTVVESLFKLHPHLESGTTEIRKIDRTVVLFVCDGEIVISCNEYIDRKVSKGQMCLLPFNSTLQGRVTQEATLISCAFVRFANFLNQELSENMAVKDCYDFTVLSICESLGEFLRFVTHCLSDGFTCVHYHKLLEQQLLILLRAYYSKKELALFFHPIISNNLDFRDFVLSNYKKIQSVENFASLANMSLSTFNRHFKHTFRESAQKWMLKRKAELIYMDISISDKSFAEIAFDHNFSTQAYLSTFCRKHFKKTPQEIRSEPLSPCLRP